MARTSSFRIRHRIAAGISLLLAVCLLSFPAHATLLLPLSEPDWMELTEKQREILQPLANEWDQMENFRRKKWLGIAQRYPKLSANEQQRIQRRMRDWANLSAADRNQIRERFKTLQKAPPEERAALKQKWQEYKELPEAEKERLRQQSRVKAAEKRPAPRPPEKTQATTAQPQSVPASVIAPAPSLPPGLTQPGIAPAVTNNSATPPRTTP